MKAVQILLQEKDFDESILSDEELEKEQARLLLELQQRIEKEGYVCDKRKKTAKSRTKTRKTSKKTKREDSKE